MSTRTQAEDTAKTITITPTAMMALTAPSDSPLPSRPDGAELGGADQLHRQRLRRVDRVDGQQAQAPGRLPVRLQGLLHTGRASQYFGLTAGQAASNGRLQFLSRLVCAEAMWVGLQAMGVCISFPD